MTNPDTPSLTVTSFRGLTNRLRVMLSAIALAEATGRHLCILWAPTRDCAARFDDLFQVPPFAGVDMRRVTIEEVPLSSVIDLPSVPFGGGGERLPDLTADVTRHIALEYVAWLVQPERFPHHAPLYQRCAELLATIRPIASIAERATHFQSEYFRPIMIGVHLRRGDMLRAYPDKVNNTDAALAAVDGYLDRQPDAGIFLATDDGAVDQHTVSVRHDGLRDLFQRRYGDRVVGAAPRSLDRRSPIAIQDALVDLLLLRATDFFVGTRVSTFSHMVTFGRSVPATLCAGAEPPYRGLAYFARRSGMKLVPLWLRVKRLPARLWERLQQRYAPAAYRRARLRRWSLP